jgi:hypothetical protein
MDTEAYTKLPIQTPIYKKNGGFAGESGDISTSRWFNKTTQQSYGISKLFATCAFGSRSGYLSACMLLKVACAKRRRMLNFKPQTKTFS